jgi:hypothetical protein
MDKFKLIPLVKYEKAWFREILECLDEKIKFVTFEYFNDKYAYCCFDFENKSMEPIFVDGNPVIFLNLLDRLLEEDNYLVKAGKKELKKFNSFGKLNQGLFFSRVPIEVVGHLAAKFGVFYGDIENTNREMEDLEGEEDN